MRLTVLTPTERAFDGPVEAILADTVDGSSSILPRRLDMATVLRTGVLVATTEDGGEQYVAVQGGALVKAGSQVWVATPRAVAGDDLLALRRLIEERLGEVDEEARGAAAALARCELGIIRRLRDLQGELHDRP